MDIFEQTDKYNDLLASHIKELPGKMFTFEITKCCGYSTLIFLYKEDKLIDLYIQVAKHFGCKNIAGLYILGKDEKIINLPLNSNTTLNEFINDTRTNNKPIYDVPLPVVYRIYFDDGYHEDHVHKSSV